MLRLLRASCTPVLLLLAASSAWGALPSADALLKDVGYSPEEIASIRAGTIVRRETKGAGDRDLTTGFAFFVKVPPAVLSKQLRAGALQAVDPNTLATGTLSGASAVGAFARLKLEPGAESRLKRYRSARPGTDLNLSSAEIAALNGLGPSAPASAVEAQLRSALLARYQAYRTRGLAGIASYDRGDGNVRAPRVELTEVMKSLPLQKYAPAAWAAMLNYPAARVARSEQVFRWEQFKANGVPTIALSHGLSVPDGDAFLMLQRQFYVSEGFNCEQAITALLPVEGGTVVIYSNHTSTDQVEGVAGGTKRSIGRGIMAAELESLFGKLQRQAK